MTHRRPAALALVIVLALVGGVVLLASAGGLGPLLSLRPAARGPASEAEAPGGEPRATSGDQRARQLPSGAATVAPAGTPAATAAAASVATFGAAGSPTLPATVTLTPQPPRPSGTPLPFRIVGPLAIDGPRRRLYAPVEVYGEGRIGVFSAEDGSRLGVLNLNGAVAVDAERGRLLVDDPATGLHVLDADGGRVPTFIPIPTSTPNLAPDPRYDLDFRAVSALVPPLPSSVSQTVLIARGQVLWQVDLGTGKLVPHQLQPSELGIWERYFRLDRFLTYGGSHGPLAMITYLGPVAGPQHQPVLLSDTLAEVARPIKGLDGECRVESIAAWDDRMALSCGYRTGPRDWVLVRDDQVRGHRSHVPPASFHWLPGRDLLLAETTSVAGSFLLLDPEDLTPRGVLPVKPEGHLVGYDGVSDNLLFQADSSRLVVMSMADAMATATAPPQPAPSANSVLRWTANGEEVLPPTPIAGPTNDLRQAWTCAASPGFAFDQTALCGGEEQGLHRTEDGGRSYRPAMRHLPSWAVDAISLSPGFAQDRLAFVALDPIWGVGELPATLYQSQDAGDTWQPSGQLAALAFAPDYLRSRRIYGFGYGGAGGVAPRQAYRSDDAGRSWQALGQLPDEGSAIRQLYAYEQASADHPVLLALGFATLWEAMRVQTRWPNTDPVVYRSTDGGWTWKAAVGALGFPSHPTGILTVKSNVAARALFLLGWEDLQHSPRFNLGFARGLHRGLTLRSYDLGATWHGVSYGSGPDSRPMFTDEEGALIGFDADKAAYASSTPEPWPPPEATQPPGAGP